MGRFIDLTGQRFGRLVVKQLLAIKKGRGSCWRCECDCGNETTAFANLLKAGHVKSCGCLARDCKKELRKTSIKTNRYEFFEDCVKGYDNKGNFFIIDIDDYEKVQPYRWSLNNHKYWRKGQRQESDAILLHCFILGKRNKENQYTIDHEDRNKNNNKKSNLRKCTYQQNNCNSVIPKNNKSGVLGVFWDKSRLKWTSRIQVHEKSYYLGRYEYKEDAIKARLEAEVKYFGDFAPQKHLFEQYDIQSERYIEGDE